MTRDKQPHRAGEHAAKKTAEPILDKDDDFQRAMADVVPLPPDPRGRVRPARPVHMPEPPSDAVPAPRDASLLDDEDADGSYAADGVDRRELRKLKRFAVGAVILTAIVISSTFIFGRPKGAVQQVDLSSVQNEEKAEDRDSHLTKSSAKKTVAKSETKVAEQKNEQAIASSETVPPVATPLANVERKEELTAQASAPVGGWPAVKIADELDLPVTERQPDPEEREVMALASDLTVPPPPKFPSSDEFPTAPINWGEEKRAQRELPQPEKNIGAPKILTDDERKELLDQKIELREQIADVDIRFEVLSLESEAEIQERRAKIEKQLDAAERASERVRSELTKVEELITKWKDRSKSGYSRDFIRELAAYDESLKRLDEDYQTSRLKRQEALEAFGNAPRDSATSQRLSEATKAEEERRVILMQIAQRVISSQLATLVEKRAVLSIELEDLLRLFRRAGRQLGLTKFVKPNDDERNTKELERIAAERNRLTVRFEEVASRFSDFAELEFRRAQASQ